MYDLSIKEIYLAIYSNRLVIVSLTIQVVYSSQFTLNTPAKKFTSNLTCHMSKLGFEVQDKKLICLKMLIKLTIS